MTHIGPYQINSIVTGDSRELAKAIPDGSIDLILTDPEYDKVEDYAWLAETAMRVLRPNSTVLAFSNWRFVARAQIAMEDAGLTFQWIFNYTIPGKPGALHLYGIYPCTTPCLFMAKGRSKASPYIPDHIISHAQAENDFKWQKNTGLLTRWVETFSKPGALVWDAFSGSGSTCIAAKRAGRNFIGFELNGDRAETARHRVALTPMPLPFEPLMEQQALLGITPSGQRGEQR